MAGRVKRVNVRHGSKFRGDRWNRYWHMAIFRFFQDGGRPHLGFVMRVLAPPWWSLSLCKIWSESVL